MIKNSHEYDLTNSLIKQFNERRTFLMEQERTDEIEYEIAGIAAISEDLKQQLCWYDAVKNGEVVFKVIDSLFELPKVLIGKRLQLGLSQSELAEKLSMDTDDYIRLENEDFYGLTFELLQKILFILDLDNPNHILEKNYEQLLPTIESNLKKLNVNKRFLESFIPTDIQQVRETLRSRLSSASYLTEEFLEAFKKIFSVSLEEDISPSDLNSNLAFAFKRNINVSENNLTFTTAYAAYVSGIIAHQMPPSSTLKADPINIREEILGTYGAVNIENCLRFIWGLNIAVVPLHFHGSFHGACFDFNDTRTIALSQQNQTVSRWKFDMLHELYHALTMDYNAYIERTEIMDQDDEEESLASEFASYVIFGQEMDSFIELVLKRSDGQVERIKNNLISVAREYGIDIDDFSNYVAYRIRPVNFWGVAANLQVDKRNPAAILREYLLSHLDITRMNSFELEVLQKALNQEVF